MTTTIAPPLTIEIAEEIRRDAKLLEAVNIASQQLEDFLDADITEIDRHDLRWKLSRIPDEIIAEFSECDRYGERRSKLSIPTRRMFDPVLREVAMIQLRRKTFGILFDQIGVSLDQKMATLDREEQNAD